MEIVIEDDIFVTENIHVVDTRLHIEHDGYCFPFDDWTDFTFPILEEWKVNMLKAKNLDNVSFELYFHDGPFWLEVYKNDNMELKIECINDRKSGLTIDCGYNEFLHAIYSALKAFARILYNNGMHRGDFSDIYKQTIVSVSELSKLLNAV